MLACWEKFPYLLDNSCGATDSKIAELTSDVPAPWPLQTVSICGEDTTIVGCNASHQANTKCRIKLLAVVDQSRGISDSGG